MENKRAESRVFRGFLLIIFIYAILRAFILPATAQEQLLLPGEWYYAEDTSVVMDWNTYQVYHIQSIKADRLMTIVPKFRAANDSLISKLNETITNYETLTSNHELINNNRQEINRLLTTENKQLRKTNRRLFLSNKILAGTNLIVPVALLIILL